MADAEAETPPITTSDGQCIEERSIERIECTWILVSTRYARYYQLSAAKSGSKYDDERVQNMINEAETSTCSSCFLNSFLRVSLKARYYVRKLGLRT